MKLTKRIVALLICVMMIVTAFPAGIFAATEESTSTISADATESALNMFHEHLDFEDMGSTDIKTYMAAALADSGMSYSNSTAWSAVTEGDNTYLALRSADQTAFGLVAPDYFSNQTIEITFDVRLSYNEKSGTGSLFFPLVRLSPGTGTSTGTTNALVIETPASANREDNKLMGNLVYTKLDGTAGKTTLGTGHSLYADTWYTFRIVYDNAPHGKYTYNSTTYDVTKGYVYMTEEGGSEKPLGEIECKYFSTLNRILFGRGYSSTFVNVDLDNVKITAVPDSALIPTMDTYTDFEKLAADSSVYIDSTGLLVDSTTEGAVNALTYKSFNATAGLNGLTMADNSMKTEKGYYPWYVATENGNSYLQKMADQNRSLNLYDPANVLKNGKFEISFDLLPGDTMQAGGVLSLKDAAGINSVSSTGGESRIISIQKLSGVSGFTDGYYLTLGKTTAFPIYMLTSGEWVQITVTVDPTTSDYEIWINGELILYTRIDEATTTDSAIYHKIWRKGEWSSTKVLSTNASYPFDADLATQIKYVYLFHSYSCPIGIDNLRIRSTEKLPAATAKKADGTLYSMSFDSTSESICKDCLTAASSTAQLLGISASSNPSVSGGALVNTKVGGSRMELALSTNTYTYLEDGVLCVEGKLTPNAFSGNTGEFVFAALNRYTTASNVATAKLVTVSADGKVSVGTKANVATLTTGKTHTIKVYVDTETMLATLFVDGVRKAINIELEMDLRLAPVIDRRDILVPAIGADGCVTNKVSNSATTVGDYIRFDCGNQPAVLDTVTLFDSTVSTDTWGFKADDVKISYTTSVDDADVDLNFDADIIDEAFTSTDAVVSDGVLNIATGGSVIWNDANLDTVNWLSDRGMAVEVKVKADATGETKSLIQIASGSTYKDLLAIDGNGNILAGDTVGKYPIASSDSNTYTAVQLVFSAGTSKVGVYADGKILGSLNYSLGYMSMNDCKICFLGEAIFDEIKIHATMVRDYAKETGNLFDWDMEYYTPGAGSLSPSASTGTAPTDGFLVPGSMSTYIAPTAENGETRSFIRRTGTNASQTEVFATGHFVDTVTVLEATIRNTVPGKSGSSTDIFRIRKGTYNGSDFIYLLHMANDTGYFSYRSKGTLYYLCDKDGNLYTANSETDWTRVAVVYDAISATMRYTVNNELAYCKTSTAEGAPIGYADNYSVNQLEWNSLVPEEVRVRLYVTSGTGTLDVANYRAYEIDPTATAEIVGSQVSTSGDAIRILAGVDMLHYGTIGFKVEYFDATGKQVGKAQVVDSRNVFLSVVGGGETYLAEELGYRYLTAVAIEGIQTPEGSYRVTPFTTLGGIKNADAVVYYGTPHTVVMDSTIEEGIRHEEKTTPIADAIYDISEVEQFRGNGLNFNGIDATFTFSANCEGDVSLNLVTARQLSSVDSSTFELWVDGVKQDDIVIEIGHHSLTLAEDLKSGEHIFKLVKKTGGDYAHIYSITLDGTFTDTATAGRKNGVMLEVAAPEPGETYGNFYIYTQTSDPTGEYYIKYNFLYELDESYPQAVNVSKGNTGYNRSNYRIREAYLVKYDSSTGSFSNVWRVLHQGEISLAIKESGADDFIGGYHGDERLESVELFMDGAAVDLTKSSSLRTGSKLIFKQTTILNSSDKPLQNVARHIQNYVIDSSGIRNRQQVEILSDDFNPLASSQVYLQMFTYYRTSGDTLLCDTVNFLDATGNLAPLTSAEISAGKINTFKASDLYTSGSDKSVSGSTSTRYMEYIGANDNGLYGKAGFNITDHSVTISSITGSIRRYNDVKWYPSFIGRKTSPVAGEVWSADLYYVIDYINPDNVVDEEDPVVPPVETPEGETPSSDVASATGSASVVLDTTVDYNGDNSSYKVVTSAAASGIALKQLLNLSAADVGKTYCITAYVYADADVNTTAFRVSVANQSFDAVSSSYNFAIKAKTWNKVTLLYKVTDVNNAVIMIDQDVSGALSAPSSALCTTFYVDNVSAELYVAQSNSKYEIYTTEDFEDSPTSFSKYGTGSYDALIAESDEYMTGGQFTGVSKVGALNWNVHSGNKALTVYPFGLYSTGAFSARIKLSHLLPDDIGNYVGYTFKISAYIMMDDMSAGEGTSITTNFGIMGDKTPNWKNLTSVTFKEGVWTYVEHEVEITADILNSLTEFDKDADGNSRYYPARVFLDFGSNTNYPGVVYFDDITVEFQAPNA